MHAGKDSVIFHITSFVSLGPHFAINYYFKISGDLDGYGGIIQFGLNEKKSK